MVTRRLQPPLCGIARRRSDQLRRLLHLEQVSSPPSFT